MKGRFLAKLRKSISALLALVMVLALVPMTALAAASDWKITDAEGTEIIAGEDGTIAVPSETDADDGKAKATFKIDKGADADTKNYYIFDKLDNDTNQYYVLATVTDAAITVVADEAVKATANIEDITLDTGVFTATLANAANSATLAAGPSAADVIDFTITPPAAAVEDNKVTVETPTTDDNGKAEVTVTVKEDDLNNLIKKAKENDGHVEIEIPNSEAEDVQEVAVTLPDNLITEAKKSDSGVYNVGVVTPVGYVGLPVSELTTGTKISISAEVTVQDDKIKGGISLSMTQDGREKSRFDIPVYVAFGVEGIGNMTNPIVAFVNEAGKYVRTRSGIDMDDQEPTRPVGLHFQTRHFSEFVAVEVEKCEPAIMTNKATNAGVHTFEIEADETLVYVTKDANGVYTYSYNAGKGEMGDSLVDATVGSSDTDAFAAAYAVFSEDDSFTVGFKNGMVDIDQVYVIRQDIAPLPSD